MNDLIERLLEWIGSSCEDDTREAATVIETQAAQIDTLERKLAVKDEALRVFLDDDRFDIMVGGNPNAVQQMFETARAALEAPDA